MLPGKLITSADHLAHRVRHRATTVRVLADKDREANGKMINTMASALLTGTLRGAPLRNRTPDLRITRVTAQFPACSTSTDSTPHSTGSTPRPAERRTTCQNSCQRRTHAWQGDRLLSDAFCMRRPNR